MQKFKQDYKELAEKVESGEYFNEARDWYVKTYLYNFVERSYLIVLILMLVFLYGMTKMYKHAIMPIKKSLPVRVDIPSAAEFSTRITYLGNKDKNFNVNNVLMKYFTARFVEAIESYDFKDEFKKLKANKSMIQSLASGEIYDYYVDKISIRNPDSIILKYRKNIYRTIEVDKSNLDIVELQEDNESSYTESDDGKKDSDIKKYRAVINFKATEINKDAGTAEKSNWQAKIVLSFQTIKYNFEKKDFNPLNFKVLSYESKKID